MVHGVAEDRVAFLDERGDGPGVGREAGGKHERGFGAFERGELPLQLGVQFAAAADKWTRSAAPPSALRRRAGGRDQPFVGRQPEIIVATKIDEFATIEFNAHRLRALAHGKLTAQPSAIQSLELLVDPR